MSEILEDTVQMPEGNEPEFVPAAEPSKRTKVPLTCRMWAKVTAFILAVVMVCVCGLGVLAAAVMVSEDVYTVSQSQYLDTALGDLARSDGYHVANTVLMGENPDGAREYLRYRNVARAELRFDGTNLIQWSYVGKDMKASDTRVYERTFNWWMGEDGGNRLTHWAYEEGATLLQSGTVTIWLADEFTQQDEYWVTQTILNAMYYFRYSVYVIIAVSAVLTIACFIFLLCASGHHPDHEGVRPGWGTKIPVDALSVGMGFLVLLVCELMQQASWNDDVTMVVVWAAGTLALLTMFLGWCMSFALRLKLGGWWKNSVCWWCLRLCWAVCQFSWKALRAVGRGIAGLVLGVPLVWKVLALFFVVACWEFVMWAMFHWNPGAMLLWWFLEKLIFLPFILAVSLMLRRLERGGRAIAEGDLNYQVDTRHMLPVFKRHAENLNCIGEGMNRAVEERIKSERMKTELITNVSHDIKTPLTSIINYADLIGKEPCDNEKIGEYADVLHRQSERLKRLIDDLVEASKASTGNLDIDLVPCEVGVLLTQTAGEYEYRLRERGLELVTKQPDKPLKIMADGRRLWRVFDNLMNNICKYGQSGTRVYLTLEKLNGQAVISFKNTSREQLNLSPEELMERFVRGDAARKSEGNGLGLSIARSLTELQRGKLELSVDGDLFKAVLRFPLIP